MEGPTDKYVWFKSKLDRKDCRILIGYLTGDINLQDHAVQDMGSKNFLMQMMQRRKRNNGAYSG